MKITKVFVHLRKSLSLDYNSVSLEMGMEVDLGKGVSEQKAKRMRQKMKKELEKNIDEVLQRDIMKHYEKATELRDELGVK